jgi:hypothetical protein
MKALEDKNNFDAEIQMAYLSPDLSFSVEVLEFAEVKGLAPSVRSLLSISYNSSPARALLMDRLGADCFADDGPCVGKFCSAELLLTRPYMRVLQALVRMCFETKQYEKGACVYQLHLHIDCISDNVLSAAQSSRCCASAQKTTSINAGGWALSSSA